MLVTQLRVAAPGPAAAGAQLMLLFIVLRLRCYCCCAGLLEACRLCNPWQQTGSAIDARVLLLGVLHQHQKHSTWQQIEFLRTFTSINAL
jgi:hypothetical protein